MGCPATGAVTDISDGIARDCKIEIVSGIRVPGAMQRFFGAASQNRDRTKDGVRYDPGSAAHHAAEEAARCAASGARMLVRQDAFFAHTLLSWNAAPPLRHRSAY
jgi:hypothetical protein